VAERCGDIGVAVLAQKTEHGIASAARTWSAAAERTWLASLPSVASRHRASVSRYASVAESDVIAQWRKLGSQD
jgi:hypothetical protein